MPLSRLWAAANAAGDGCGAVPRAVGAPPAFWTASICAACWRHHDRLRRPPRRARGVGERDLRSRGDADPGTLDRRRRAPRHATS
jgi:hypothetical protein